MKKIFYTQEQKDVLKEMSKDKLQKRIPMSEATAALVLDALGEQQNTLQNIEGILRRIENILQVQQS